MKSFKVKTTGKDMLSDIVLAGYDASVRADQVPPPCDDMLQYGHEGGIRMTNADNPYITLAQAMEQFSLSRQTIYRLRKEGHLPDYELGGRKYVDIRDLLVLITKTKRTEGQ